MIRIITVKDRMPANKSTYILIDISSIKYSSYQFISNFYLEQYTSGNIKIKNIQND